MKINHIGVNQLVYGIKLYTKSKKIKSEVIIMLSPTESRMIQILEPTGAYNTYFDLTEISDIQIKGQNKLKIINVQGGNLKMYFTDQFSLMSIKEGLEYLIQQAQEVQTKLDSYNHIWSNALKLITKSDVDMDNRLNFKEFQYLVGELQIQIAERKLLNIFENHSKKGNIEQNELYKLLMEITLKHELIPLYQQYCSIKDSSQEDPYSKPLMNSHDLETFFLIEQGDKSFKATKNTYNFYDFQNLIFSNSNSIFQSKPIDLSHPITHYLINSSHNTYLEANQLTGQSSCYAYQDAFKQGFKCVELDCWDGNDGEPIVTHGHTLVNDIKFKDVIITVREYAFHKDDNPAILSLEMHCSLKQQKRIAEILKQVLGEQLFIVKDFSAKQFSILADLQKKVLIKFKANQQYLEEKLSKHDGTLSLYCTQTAETLLIRFDDEEESNHIQPSQFSQTVQNENEKVCRELLDCTSLYAVSFQMNQKPDLVWIVSSVSEDKIQSKIKQNPQLFKEYSDNYFVRIYPLGLRFDSSNYDPFPSWCSGAQMVALNIQTKDLFMLQNYGMFLNSSYILKQQDISMKFEITIISACNLTWEDQKRRQEEVVDPYIKVRIAGNKEDVSNSEKWRTEVVQDNGYHPIFQYSCQIALKHAQHDVVYFQAYSYSLLGDSLIGQYALSPLNIRRGYRVVPLLNSQLRNQSNVFALVHVKIL